MIRILLAILTALLLSACSNEKEKQPAELVLEEIHKLQSLFKEGKFYDVYKETHSEFQNTTPYERFKLLCKVYKLDQITDQELEEPGFTKNVGTVSGSLLDENRVALPVLMKFSQDNQQWKLIHIEFDSRKYFENRGMQEPSRDDMLRLAKDWLQLFQKSTKKHNMKEFYESISDFWKLTATLEDMNHFYGPFFIHQQFKNERLDGAKLILHPSSGVKTNGVLFLKGRFESTHFSIDFEYEFFFEDFKWKPIRFDMKM
jgi:hypothetical protein